METNHYVKNADLYNEIVKYKESGKFSEELGKMLLLIAEHYTNKTQFIGYTWKADMVGEAVLTCIKYMKSFNPEKSTNAFGYITQIVKNSFKAYLKNQKKHAEIKSVCYDRHTLLLDEDDGIAINYQILINKK